MGITIGGQGLSTLGNIIIIDDSDLVRKQIKSVCMEGGYKNLSEAKNGQEGLNLAKLQIARGEQIAMMLVDMNMPGLNGIETIREIKKDPELRHIPIIMVTTESENSNVVLAIESGASEYIVKPIDEALLLEKVNKITFR